MMTDERFDNLNEIAEDSDLEEQAQLYEHFRVVADKGQEPLRVDKFLFEHFIIREIRELNIGQVTKINITVAGKA